jgi:signal transduction histidine kinase
VKGCAAASSQSFTCGVIIALGLVLNTSAQEVLTRLTQIRGMTPEAADAGLPVRIQGWITFCDPAWNVAFVHDGEHSLFIRLHNDSPWFQRLNSGDAVEVSGVTHRGDFLNVIEGPNRVSASFRLLEPKPLPAPVDVPFSTFMNPSSDCEWVRLEGVIRAVLRVEHRTVLKLEVEGRPVNGYLPSLILPEQIPSGHVGVRVHLTGAVGTQFNSQRQMTRRYLHIPGPQFIQPLTTERELDDTQEMPLTNPSQLMRYGGAGPSDRVRVQGQVTAVVEDAGVYLRGEDGALWVDTARNPSDVKPGDWVEVVGIPAIANFKPELYAAALRQIGSRSEITPQIMDAATALEGHHHGELVQMEGVVTAQERSREGHRLFATSGDTVFEVMLPRGEQPPPANLSKVKVTGICLVTLSSEYRSMHRGDALKLQCRTPGDLAVMEDPPWWTSRRLHWGLGGLAVTAMLVSSWAVTLRRQVKAQADVIRRHAMHEARHEERERIARDLHDTLEQDLMGVTLVLDDTAAKLDAGGTTVKHQLGLARRLLRRAREESRSTIRDLRSITLELRGLVAALNEMVRPIATHAGVAFHVSVNGQPRQELGVVENHLLLIAREAVHNTVRHASASRVDIVLAYGADHMEMDIQDDGRGFVSEGGPPEGDHFGLRGMKERAEKIHAQLHLTSAPGHGTRVHVTVPLSSAAGKSQPSRVP